jgi:hypothetical protein
MDLRSLLEQLRQEKNRIERIITGLEQLHEISDDVMSKHRGRKSMSHAERLTAHLFHLVVSERMKRYWASRGIQKAG